LFISNLHSKIITIWEKRFFCRYRKDFGSKLYLFPCKNYSFWGLFFSLFWFVKRHSFKPCALHFQLNYECDVIFAVPQICAYFVDNLHYLEIDSFKIAVSEHILLYFKNSNSFFLCTHDNVQHTLCQTIMTHGVLSLSTYFHRICGFIHILR
jgi:hypothetical protein